MIRAILSLRVVIIVINVAVGIIIMLLLVVLVIDRSIDDIIKKGIKNLSRHHHIVVININDSDLVGNSDDDHADIILMIGILYTIYYFKDDTINIIIPCFSLRFVQTCFDRRHSCSNPIQLL